jgi:hypothetical protein
VIAAIVALSGACSRKSSEPTPTTPAAPPEPVAAAEGAPDQNAPSMHGLRKQKNLDVPVFVDGKELAVMRFGELPSGVEPIAIESDPRHRVRFYRVADYLKAVGVNVDRLKSVHFADKGSRIASIEGSELRADKNRFVFDFYQTTTGAPAQAWITTGLKNRLRIDDIVGVNVFVDKQPTEIDPHYHCYLDDGECVPVNRFGTGDLMKGTRVYDDGKLVGYVKRRQLADSALAGKTAKGDTVFSFDKYLASLGIKTTDAKEIRLLAGDDVVASATAKEWAADSDKLTFYLVPHAHGKVRGNVPADMQKGQEGTKDRDVQITAIQVFKHKEPRSVPVVSIDKVFDPGVNAAALELAYAQANNGDGDSD